MKVIDQKPVPIYEVICDECKSKIHYKASEVRLCHITCPVCGTSLWAHTTYPVEYERVSESVDVVEVVRCGDCRHCSIDYYPDGNEPTYACLLEDMGTNKDFYCANGER